MLALTTLASVVTGLILLAIGFRGRRLDRHRRCRRCGYDLSGNEDSRSCPECGRPLLGARAIRVGHRRRHPALIVAGLVVALVGGGGGAALLLTRTAPGDIKPVWLLAWEMKHRGAGAGRAAYDELTGRLNTGALSQEEIAQFATACLHWMYDLDRTWDTRWEIVVALAPVPVDPAGRAPHTIAAVLLKQAQPDVPWRPDLGDRVEWLRLNGFVSDEAWTTYLRQSVESEYTFSAPPRIRPSNRLRISYRRGAPRVGTMFAQRAVTNDGVTRWRLALDVSPPMVDGASVDANSTSVQSSYTWLTDPSDSGSTAKPHRLTPGTYAIDLPVRFTLVRQRAGTAPPPGPRDPDADSAMTEIASWERTYRIPIEIVPDSVELVALVADPARADDVRNAMTLRVRRGDEDQRGGFERRMAIEVDEAPLDMAFEVLLRRDGREVPLTRFAATTGANLGVSCGWPDAVWLQALDRADAVFRPDVPAAEEHGLASIWSGEIIFPGVCLKRLPFRDALPDEQRDRFREIIDVHPPIVLETRDDHLRGVLALTFRELPERFHHRVACRLGERTFPLDPLTGNPGDWKYLITELTLDGRTDLPATFTLELNPIAPVAPDAPVNTWPGAFTIPDIRLPAPTEP